jgi:hypothetical protein
MGLFKEYGANVLSPPIVKTSSLTPMLPLDATDAPNAPFT